MNWYKEVLTTKYAEFTGRARRAEYWNFVLVNTIIGLVLYGPAEENSLANGGKPVGVFMILAILYGIYALAVLVPSIAVAARRLHDTGRSGWFQLLAFIPCIGPIILLVFLVGDSQPGANKWGPNPKEETPTA